MTTGSIDDIYVYNLKWFSLKSDKISMSGQCHMAGVAIATLTFDPPVIAGHTNITD